MHSHHTSWRSSLILSSHPRLLLSFPSCLFPTGLITKILWEPLLLVPYSPPISCYCSHKQYLVRIVDHEVIRYAVFSTLLLPRPLGPNIFLRTLFPNTLSLHPSLTVRDQIWHPYKKETKLVICVLILYSLFRAS